MNIIIIVVAVTAGVILGGTAIYVYQGKCRQKELKLLAECMEKILREEKIRETKAGEETLYARLESRLVRIQKMLNGRTETAEKSKDEIQKLFGDVTYVTAEGVDGELAFITSSMTEGSFADITAKIDKIFSIIRVAF